MYLAFRTAFLTTFDTLECELERDGVEAKGFLEHIPLAAGCATQVQIDCLLQTWQQISSAHGQIGVIGQVVCYCAVSELARAGALDNHRILTFATAGPRPVTEIDALWLASKIRSLQIAWPTDSSSPDVIRDCHLLTADLDGPGLDQVSADTRLELLEIVGAWQVSPGILSNGVGLLSDAERSNLGSLLQKHPRLLNL